MMIYKGVNHPGYYKNLQHKPDILSAYTDVEEAQYFENDLLSSYTLSEHVADKFVSGTINQKGQRRLKIEGSPEIIEDRILSSWIVSQVFLNGQYEILCLPNTYTLKTKCTYFNEIVSGFRLEKEQDNFRKT